MSAWSGWIGDMIAGLGIPDTGDNRNFLAGWALYDPSPCQFNPLVCPQQITSSTDCKQAPGGAYVQSYPSHAASITATRRWLHSGLFPLLRVELDTGHPLATSDPQGLVNELLLWPAAGWAAQVADKTGATVPGVSRSDATHVHKAWTRWMHGLAHTGPESHRRIRRATARARRIAR